VGTDVGKVNHLPTGEGSGEGLGSGLCPPPQKKIEFGALKWHILVHSGALHGLKHVTSHLREVDCHNSQFNRLLFHMVQQ